jgi:fluoride exporter
MMRPDDPESDICRAGWAAGTRGPVVSTGAAAAAPQQVTAAKRPPRPGPHRDPRVLGGVAVGGVVGALLRAELEDRFPVGGGFPWTTLVINIAGAAILAWIVVRVGERLPPSTYIRPLLGTGFCGALTTFSTMQVEAVRLVYHGHAVTAGAYLLVSLLGGLLATAYVLRAARRAPWTA